MDINYNQKKQPLRALAEKENAIYIDGSSMFKYQALAQQLYWQA